MPHKILAVDDEPMLLNLLIFQLEDAGFEVSTAIDGQEALKQIESVHPDLVLLDIRLPKLDGFQVMEQLRSEKQWDALRVLFMTADVSLDLDEAVRKYKATGYLTKPFSCDDMVNRIHGILDS